MTPRDLRNIHTTGNSCRDTLPCANMALKLSRYFYLLMEKLLGRYFQVRSPYYQAAQCNQKTPIPVPRNSHTSPLFKQSSILKFQDKICLENILFVSKSLNNLSPSVFNTWFVFSSGQHGYEISRSTQGILIKCFYKTNR